MSELIIELSEQAIVSEVLEEKGAVLLDLWAPWCAPCKALSPILEKISRDYVGTLKFAKINVEEFPDVQRRFGVRGIPTLLLFRGGEEISRSLGLKSASDLNHWLQRNDVAQGVAQPAVAEPEGNLAGAFYSDADLKAFLVARLVRRIDEGALVPTGGPAWSEGKGSLSCILVGSDDPAVFRGMASLPASFASAMEFCLPTSISGADAGTSLEKIKPGSDLRGVAPSIMHTLFSDELADWSRLLADINLDTSRKKWLALVQRYLAHQSIAKEEWLALAEELRAQRSPGETVDRALHDDVIGCLLSVTPIPDADDAGGWVQALPMQGRYMCFLLTAFNQGWSVRQMGFERMRHNWFVAREKQEESGEFSEESLEAARSEWLESHGEEQRAFDQLMENFDQNVQPLRKHFQASFDRLLETAPSHHPD